MTRDEHGELQAVTRQRGGGAASKRRVVCLHGMTLLQGQRFAAPLLRPRH
jgi:hypothetical protein